MKNQDETHLMYFSLLPIFFHSLHGNTTSDLKKIREPNFQQSADKASIPNISSENVT